LRSAICATRSKTPAVPRPDTAHTGPFISTGIDAEDIAPAFDALKGRVDALYVATAPLLTTNLVRINTLALAARLPTIAWLREFTVAGGLMSYGPNFPSLSRRAADYVDKVLRGAKPSDLPVEQSTRFEFVLNLATAKTLHLNVPDKLLALADEVIE
jgi:putative tryptophan/tyrosine transport system substrate-binding protein